jgi:poly(3-hydroxybutyrate) depolymerase
LLVDASSGCGKPAPPGGSAADPIELGANRYYVKVPPSYDPGRPYPLLFVFHPSNNPIDWAEKNSGFEEAGARGAAIIVYPGSAGKGWEAADVVLFEPLYQQLTENYCVDLARVFAAGESSGGDYSSILGCEFGDKLTAIGPCATKAVAAYPLEVAKRACKGSVSAVIIHGVRDSVVGAENGPATRDFYQTLNQCAPTSTPVDGYTDDQSNCVKFDGCAAERATYWCQHNDPNYGNTNHGWPAFAGKMLWEHFSSF